MNSIEIIKSLPKVELHVHTVGSIQPQTLLGIIRDEGLKTPYNIVDDIIRRNKDKKGPLMTILQQINTEYNYLPENVLRYVSQEIKLPLSHILKIATFYSSLSIVPRGKYIINVCMGTACYVKGSGRLMERLSEELEIKENETTPDMLFTLKSVRCIGCCGLAPATMVGENVHGKLSTKEIPGIVKKYKSMG